MATHRQGTAEDLAKVPALFIAFGPRPTQSQPSEPASQRSPKTRRRSEPAEAPRAADDEAALPEFPGLVWRAHREVPEEEQTWQIHMRPKGVSS
jgi:hypothetical protein